MKDTWIYACIYGGREEESLLSTSVRRTFSSNERLQVRAHRMPPGATGCKDGHDGIRHPSVILCAKYTISDAFCLLKVCQFFHNELINHVFKIDQNILLLR
jgi:hypothetical protein